MTNFKELILKNPDAEFVVHTQNKQELDALVSALEELGFEYAIPLGTIGEMAEDFVCEDGYDGCWRVSSERGVAYNPSVEHWKLFTNNIVEIRDGEITFHMSYASEEAARIEENKLRKAFFEDEYSADELRLFGLENRSVEDIGNWLNEKFGMYREAEQ